VDRPGHAAGVFYFLERSSISYYLYSMAKKPTRPRDTNQLAKSIVDIATNKEESEATHTTCKNLAAVELGRLGGLKGGKARAAKLSQKRRSEIAKKAAAIRWGKKT
jgi:hypothetical protein